MSCPNFDTNNAGFPLYAREDEYFKICPECGCCCGAWDDSCDECGADLSETTPIYDEFENQYVFDTVKAAFEELNNSLDFYSISVRPGYFSGLQFKVSWKYEDPENLDNEDCHYYFDMCRSVSLRKCKSERNRIKRALADVAQENGFSVYLCTSIFSNGEAIYTKQDVIINRLSRKTKKTA